MDLLGQFLRRSPHFRGKGRLTHHWAHQPRRADFRRRELPGGASVSCDMSVPYESMIWLEQEEQVELRTLQDLLHPGDCFIDCGANLGLWTLVAARCVAPEGHVFAFEPNPVAREKLIGNIAANGLEKIVSVQFSACGESAGSARLVCDPQHNCSRLSARGETAVPVVTLDQTAGEMPVHGIKIDVEGFELQVLRGTDRILRQFRPWLCVEFNALLSETDRLADWPVHQHLDSLGYVARSFDAERSPIPADFRVRGYCNLFYAAGQ